METLVGWSVEMRYLDGERPVWRIVDLCRSSNEAESSARRTASRPDSLETRVMAYFRRDRTTESAVPTPVTLPTASHEETLESLVTLPA